MRQLGWLIAAVLWLATLTILVPFLASQKSNVAVGISIVLLLALGWTIMSAIKSLYRWCVMQTGDIAGEDNPIASENAVVRGVSEVKKAQKKKVRKKA